MPEEAKTEATQESPVKPTEPAQAPSSAPAKPETDWKAEARKWEQRAKENTEKLTELAPLSKLAAALGGGDPEKGKSELEKLHERQASLEQTLSEERAARWRAEIAHEKGLTAAQAARLAGNSREEMATDADDLLSLFPAAKPGTPAPDRSQGQSGSVPDVDSRIAEAQRAGEWRTVMKLQNEKLAAAMAAKSH